MATPPPGPMTPPHAVPDPAGDPSMEDILASIRRILNEDEAPKPAPEPGALPVESKEVPNNGVLMLDSSMMVAEPQRNAPQPKPAPERPATPEKPVLPDLEPPASRTPSPVPQPTVVSPNRPPSQSLVAPEAAAAAGASVDSLMRTLASERGTAVQRGGPTIEDLVRVEIRPLLKEWLDTHLPPLVERLVRAEIERVVGRMAP